MREGVKSPEQPAALGSKRDRGKRGRRRIEQSIDDDRRRLDFRVPVRWKVAGVIDPGALQLPDVPAIDLIERGVTRVAGTAARDAPVHCARIAPRSLGTCESRNRDDGEGSAPTAHRLPRRCQHDIAEFHGAVIALEHQRTGRTFIAIERTAGDSGYLLVADQSLAVQYHRQHASHERDIVRLPLTRFSRGGFARREKTVDRAEVILNRFERVAILDLDLVSSTKVNAAVPFGWIAKLDMQLEIVERLASDEVGAGTRVCEYAIHGTPVCSRRLPARHVRAVEESDRRPPARRRRAAQ